MIKLKIAICMLVIFSTAACSNKSRSVLSAAPSEVTKPSLPPQPLFPVTAITPSVVSTQTLTSTLLPTPTPVSTLTSTFIPPTKTRTVTITPSREKITATTKQQLTNTPIVPSSVLSYQCLEIADGLSPNMVVGGTIVMANYQDRSAQLWDMKTGDKLALPQGDNESLRYFAVSPDGKWLAYRLHQRNNSVDQLVIAPKDGIPYKVITMKKEWWSFEWLDDQRLILEVLGNQEDWITPLIVLDPFTGSQRELQMNFPGIYMDRVNWGVYSSSKSVYDPTLTRVVYPQTQADLPAILRDVQANKDLAYIPYGGYHEPKWSPDGKRVAISAVLDKKPWFEVQEFFIVDWDGVVTQSSHLSDYLGGSKIYAFNWSPDGRYIAFWLNTIPNAPPNTSHLAVLDTTAGSVTDYCVTGAPVPDHDIERNDTAPIWSPDGTQLLVDALDPNDGSRYWVIIVDINHGWAAKIAENVTPVGWMVNP
jgi:hypothetical protein